MASLTEGSGDLLVLAGGLAAQFAGTVALNIPGVTLTGALTVQLNTTGATVDQDFRIDGQTRKLELPGPSYLRFAVTGGALNVLGQTLSGDLAIAKANGVVSLDGRQCRALAGRRPAHRERRERVAGDRRHRRHRRLQRRRHDDDPGPRVQREPDRVLRHLRRPRAGHGHRRQRHGRRPVAARRLHDRGRGRTGQARRRQQLADDVAAQGSARSSTSRTPPASWSCAAAAWPAA